ncbi:DNA-directed DNA polymerase, family A, palm domain containing protein [uncultured Caudovirales phage]|uniref:DNA-directed DNA polymerase, family A, palm domain containing protein n=1 Tax=uncultured Caudovirales phage TaxID=2100421 RepID=A0A6J5LD06_9CAUD|nr:DNA-directed DNA polymerase, family A, palm domain containing protein [uncultured Caudovirales phage]CAB5222098.1 DNA-directed DNA polymerase, family A, palm domain containing protein [uncultured Caudovirales phage]
MNILALDTETTIWNKGNPYDKRNRLVCWSYSGYCGSGAELFNSLHNLVPMLADCDLVVGFNFKFDLAWFLKCKVDQLRDKHIWDVQIAEFILSHQTNRFPSLNETCERYGLETKLDVVKTEYWDKGINTDAIPWEILEEYATRDAELTLACYHAQRKLMTPAQVKLCFLMCQDMKILQEMEANGIPFDEQLCEQRAMEVDDKISTLKGKLSAIYPDVPINFASNDHLSAFLYGGVVKQDDKEHVGFFKSGAKAGQPKYKNIVIEHALPRLYEPLKGSAMAKLGNFATDEGTLRKLRGNKNVVNMILDLSKLEKLNGTYYKGLVKLREEMNWEQGMLHGNFNQTTAQTGRLSSSKPNLQNFASELQDIFVSKYHD